MASAIVTSCLGIPLPTLAGSDTFKAVAWTVTLSYSFYCWRSFNSIISVPRVCRSVMSCFAFDSSILV